jgi:hypothetical protein
MLQKEQQPPPIEPDANAAPQGVRGMTFRILAILLRAGLTASGKDNEALQLLKHSLQHIGTFQCTK